MKYKHPPLHPVMGLPLADKVNQLLCIDLKDHVHNNSWILYTIYSNRNLISSKHQDAIVQGIFLMWIAHFDAPKNFLIDKRG